jgi:hypothetical protein
MLEFILKAMPEFNTFHTLDKMFSRNLNLSEKRKYNFYNKVLR